MKVGMIFECGRDGPDQMVCTHLASIVAPHVVVEPRPLDNKGKLLDEAAKVAKALLEVSHCDRVMIIWDRKPGEAREIECEKLKRKLSEEEVPEGCVHLGCVYQPGLDTVLP